MSRAQAESVIKNIIREIIQECATKGQAVSETLVAFIVKAVVLDPKNQFNVDRTLTKDDVQRLIKICIDRLLDSRSPALDTIKMQVYFDMNYNSRQDFLDEHRRVLYARIQPVVRDITDYRARTREELDSLYRKIISGILLRSGLGSPTDIAVVREATAALQSVFPQTELGSFMAMTKKDKERQLTELTLIVTGIRLFNKDCGKGGEGIDDLPAILNEAIPATNQAIEQYLKDVVERSYKYTSLIRYIVDNDRHEGAPPVQLLSEALINARQHETFLRCLLNDIISCAQHVEALQMDLAVRMDKVRTTVQSKTAVPTAQVYPQFIELAHIWVGFQDEMVLLSVLSSIMTSLEPYGRNHKEIFNSDAIGPFLESVTVKTDEDMMEESTGTFVDEKAYREYQWLFPGTTKNFDKLELQYKGYCGWALVHYDRLLLPANPAIGVMQYKDRCYAFSSVEAAQEFARDPDGFILMIGEGAKKSPELIQLLELHTQFASITPYTGGKTTNKMIEKPITKCNAAIQTETHPLETNLVKDYEWNEWEFRRKAIKLANLRTKMTHSMQTNLSHNRRDNVAQVYLPKDQSSQTKQDGYGNVPKPQVYLNGLRGANHEFTKVDVTLDLADTPY